jgi:Uma2 family endonuclease
MAQQSFPCMSVELFRRFLDGRPEKERWELIDGLAVSMERPTLGHQHVTQNLQHLLNDALEIHAPMLTAFFWIGVNIAPSVKTHDPAPDIVVTDSDASENPDVHYVDRFYLAAEITSPSDRIHVERKREVYKLHEACSCILIVQQDRIEVRVDRRTEAGWKEQVLTNQTSSSSSQSSVCAVESPISTGGWRYNQLCRLTPSGERPRRSDRRRPRRCRRAG